MSKEKAANNLIMPQRFGIAGLLLLVLLLSSLTAFSVDIYTPALSSMPAYFGTSASFINLSITGYFLFNAIGLISFGTLSDLYGRKPLLLFGSALYTLSSFACALAPSAWIFIAFRCVQALGISCLNSIAIVVVKDCFANTIREKVYLLIQGSHIVAPIVAPLVGAQIFVAFSWRATFAIMVSIGLICFVLCLVFEDNSQQDKRGGNAHRIKGALRQFSHMKGLLRDRKFTLYLLIMTFLSAPFTVYVTVSSYIYIDYFAVSVQAYSVYYALTAACSAISLLIYAFILKNLSPQTLITLLFVVALLGVAGVVTLGQVLPLYFFIFFSMYYLVLVIIKPFVTNLLMGRQEENTGAAASLISFAPPMLGCVLTQALITLSHDYIICLSAALVICVLAGLSLWVAMCTHKKTN